jgi:hypothetical protein
VVWQKRKRIVVVWCAMGWLCTGERRFGYNPVGKYFVTQAMLYTIDGTLKLLPDGQAPVVQML